MLLHLVDVAPIDPDADPVREARAIVNELRKYDPVLAAKPRWLVFNKIDMLPEGERESRVAELLAALKKGRGRNAFPIERVFAISGLTREGCESMMLSVHEHLAKIRSDEVPVADVRFDRPPGDGANDD